jgi:hypothetical protein
MATVLRFGSFITYGSGIVAASIYFLMVNFNKPKVAKRLFSQLSLQLISLFSFGWIYFTHLTSINGKTPYEANSQLASGAGVTPLNGLIDLIELTNPFSSMSTWVNPVFGLLVIVSFFFALTNLKSKSKVRLQTLSVFVAGALSLSLLVIGVRYVQDNYLALSAPYWIILSAAGFDHVFQRHIKKYEFKLDRMLKTKVVHTTVGLLLICLPVYYFASAYMRSDAPRFGIRAAGEAIRNQTNNEKCLVLSSYPEAAWYSKCLLGLWIGTSENSPELGAASGDFNAVTAESIDFLNASRWKAIRNDEDLDNYRKFVVLVINGKRQPSDEAIEVDEVTLLEKNFTTDRVFYAEVNSESLTFP